MRNSIRRCGGTSAFRASTARWISTAQRAASRALGNEEVIPRRVDHPASMLADQGGDVLAVDLKGPHRRDFVLGQEAAVADRVAAEDGDQSVNDGVGIHCAVPGDSSEHQK
jgi:hypothetical protein